MYPPDPLDHPEPTWRAPKIPGWLFRRIRPGDFDGDTAELAIEVVRNRRGLRRLAYAVIALSVALALALVILVVRIQASDKRTAKGNDFSHATACLFLANVPDGPLVHHYLKIARTDYPDCPSYTPPRATPSATVTTTAPGKVRTSVRTVPGRPGTTVSMSGPGAPGSTVYRTRVRNHTRTKTVTATPTCAVAVLGKCVSLPPPLHAQVATAAVRSP